MFKNKNTDQKPEKNPGALKTLDGSVTIPETLPFAFQQILAMFVSNVVPIGIVAAAASPSLSDAEIIVLVQNAMIAAGIATFIQCTPIWKIGSGLPIIMGVSFTFAVPMCAIAAKHGFPGVVGAVIAGGFFEGLLGLSAKYWKRLISPIVSAVVVTGIGISLLPTAANSFGGGDTAQFGSIKNIMIGCITIITCMEWQIHTKGIVKQLSVLAGLVVGFTFALLSGAVDLTPVAQAQPFALPKILPYFPEFHLDAILSICIIYIVSATETMGDASAIVGSTLKRDITPQEVSGVLAADGFGSVIAGFFGVTPVTSYSENIGITIMTGVINRSVTRAAALIMIVCGFFPPIGAFLTSIPAPVIGGILLIILGQIVVSGFQMIADAGFTPRNKLIVSLSLAFGIGFSASTAAGIWDNFPVAIQSIFSQNVVSVIFAAAFILNLALPYTMEE